MKTHHTHHTTPPGPGRDAAMRWLAQQLRWERLLTELRTPTTESDQEEAAA